MKNDKSEVEDDDLSERAKTADLLYGEGNRRDHGKVIQDDIQDAQDKYGLSDKQASELRDGAAEVFTDLEFNTDQTTTHFDLLTHHVENPASAKTQFEWRAESRRLLRRKYGEDWEAKLKTAEKFVTNRPAFAKALHASGVGDNPKFVVSLVERVDSMKQRGALRMKPRRCR